MHEQSFRLLNHTIQEALLQGGFLLYLRWSADLGSLVGLGGSDGDVGGSGNGSPLAVAPPVFPLPSEYEDAKDRKVAAVADLRNAVKTVCWLASK